MSVVNGVRKAIASAVVDGVREAVNSTATDAKPGDTSIIARSVIDQVTPLVVNATNNEPWYQSRVTIGNYVAMAATVVGPLIGHQFDADEQVLITSCITGAGVVAGAALSLYGRWKAKKPLGA